MRSLAQPRVLARAGLAAALTALACLPRLAMWPTRAGSLAFFCLTLLWASFVLWAFVLGWHFEYSGRPALVLPRQPRLWALASAFGVAAAVFSYFLVDPEGRRAWPEGYPTDVRGWAARMLFTVSFTPLFCCFAPFAFFMRLCRQQTTSSVLTVIFGVFVVFINLRASPVPLPLWFQAEMLAGTAAVGFVFLYFYLAGGAWLVWWMLLLAQLRLLAGLI
jgi:hypothetical protein